MDQREVEVELRRLAAEAQRKSERGDMGAYGWIVQTNTYTHAADLVRDAAGWEKRSPAGEAGLREALKSARGWVVTCSESAKARADLRKIDAALSAHPSGESVKVAQVLREIAVRGDVHSVFVEIEDLAARIEGFPDSQAWALATRTSQPSPNEVER